MRRVNIKNGIKQRLNDILGTDTTGPNDNGAYEITPWSIQAAAITNMQRIVAGIAGGSDYGRPIKGLFMSTVSGLSFTISDGIGFTPEGNIVVVRTPITVQATQNVTKYIYLKHDLGILYASSDAGGKNTNFIGGDPVQEIVYDDYAACQEVIPNSEIANKIVKQEDTPPSPATGYVYLGTVTANESAITSIVNSTYRGIVEQYVDDNMMILGGDMSASPITILTSLEDDWPEGWDMNDLVVTGGKIYINNTKASSMLPIYQTDGSVYAYLEIIAISGGHALTMYHAGLSGGLQAGKYKIIVRNASST